ncbi:hypothetical protein ACQKL5_07870 [Peribacillus sp. NPDC097675]|uniref:hypothetical protein n=1 Tax=Peribacillus sp. NPDC097675 TaxID=3390618 RepID=UPI003D082EED
MDWVKLVYSIILLVCGIVILVASSSKKGDERRKFINTKAQSYVFIVVTVVLLLDVAESIYRTVQGNTHDGISPLVFLTLILIIYLLTLITYRKKYGD